MENETTTQPETQTKFELDISDIALMCNIINVSSRRGAFEAGELSIIGKFFDKIRALLPAQAASADNAEQTVASENTSDGAEQYQFAFDQ